MNDLEEKKNYRVRVGKDYSGKLLKMTLRMKQECAGKNYDVYEVCRVIDNGIDKPKFEPIYTETFTPAQIEEFYNPPVKKQFILGEQEDENLSLLDTMPGDFNIEDNLIDIFE